MLNNKKQIKVYYTTTPQNLLDHSFRIGLTLKKSYKIFNDYKVGEVQQLLWSNGMTQIIERHGEKLFSSTWK